MKKVLILYAKYGGGHLSAATAIQTYLEENFYYTVEVKCVDCVEYYSKFLSDVTTNAYKNLAKKAPKLWKKIYYGSKKGFLANVSAKANLLMAKKMLSLLNEFSPDIVVSTHPFSSQMLGILKEQKKIDCKTATVLTDFAPHDQWLIGKEYCDYFFVSTNKMRQDLIDLYGVSEKKVFATGVPLSSKFSEKIDDDKTYSTYRLNPNKKMILFFGGGEFGLGQKRTVEILKSLTSHLDEYQIVAISGRNKKMNNEFLKLYENLQNEDLHIIKYTKDVPSLMHISSLVVTKPGGLTSSESLASNLPILIINPIPGQEEENAEFLESSGSAVWLKKDDNIDEVINSLLNNPQRLEKMKAQTTQIAKPNSTMDICNIILQD